MTRIILLFLLGQVLPDAIDVIILFIKVLLIGLKNIVIFIILKIGGELLIDAIVP